MSCNAGFMTSCREVTNGLGKAIGIIAGGTVATTAAASFLGRSITQVSFAHGFGVGILAVPAIFVAMTLFEKAGVNNYWAKAALSFGTVTAVTYGASAAAAALGIVAAPITLTGALAMTAASITGMMISTIFLMKTNNCF